MRISLLPKILPMALESEPPMVAIYAGVDVTSAVETEQPRNGLGTRFGGENKRVLGPPCRHTRRAYGRACRRDALLAMQTKTPGRRFGMQQRKRTGGRWFPSSRA